MKKFLAFLFIALYGISLLRPVSPLIEYTVQYKYISEELCENIDKPEMDCQGSCYLDKQFKKINEESKEEEQNINIKWNDYPIGFVQILTSFDFEKLPLSNKNYFDDRHFKEDLFSNLIPSPPWFVS